MPDRDLMRTHQALRVLLMEDEVFTRTMQTGVIPEGRNGEAFENLRSLWKDVNTAVLEIERLEEPLQLKLRTAFHFYTQWEKEAPT